MNVVTVGPAARDDRAASELIHDHADARIVAFHLQPGQKVAPHRSMSTVTVHVTAGSGVFRGEEAEATLAIGQSAVFAPGEMHSMDAGDMALRFIAIIAPRPA